MIRFAFAVLCVFALVTTNANADDFDRFDGKKWEVHLQQWAGVLMHDDELRLENGGVVIRRAVMPKVGEYVFQWNWEKVADGKDGADSLIVMCRTTGDFKDPKAPHDVKDGFRITIHAGRGAVSILSNKTGKEIGKGELPSDDNYALHPATWHQIRVLDTGSAIAVYVGENKKPAAAAMYMAKDHPGKYFGITHSPKEGDVRTACYLRQFSVRVPDGK